MPELSNASAAKSGTRVAGEAEGTIIECRLAPGHLVAEDLAHAAGHGPAHMPGAGIQPEIPHRAGADDRRSVGRHRPQTGPVARLIIGPTLREQLAGDLQHMREMM